MTQTSHSVARGLTPELMALILIWIAFFAFGLMFGGLGPSLQELAAATNSTLVEIGLITTLSFVGGLLVQSVAGTMIDRWGTLPLLMGGSVLILIGTFGYTISPVLIVVLALAGLGGVGHGLLDVSGQLLAAQAFPRQRLRALNSVHLFFGVGAMAGPAVASFTLTQMGTALPALWLGCALFVIVIPCFWLLGRRLRLHGKVQAQVDGISSTSKAQTLYRSPLLWLLGLVILIYVGIETGIGNWTPVYMQQAVAYTAADAALVAFGYWMAFTVGRLAATLFGSQLRPHMLMLVVLLGSGAGGLLLSISGSNATLAVAATIMIGFFFGPIYPAVMAVTTEVFSVAQGKAASVIVAMGSVGGMILPWVQGVILERVSPAANTVYVLVTILAMFGVFIAVRTAERARTQVLVAAGD